MFEYRITATLKRILFGMIALALLLAPVQAALSAKTDVAMTGMAMTNMAMSKMTAMTTMDCPQTKNCCDNGKSGCPSPQSCMVQCSASFATLNSAEDRLIAFNAIVLMNSLALSPDSTAPPPLRRPPRI
jgi:hypothetical protein